VQPKWDTAFCSDSITLAIPGDMDGTWQVQVDLDQTGRSVSGTALPTLSSNVEHTFVVRGRTLKQPCA
jgi:hypothetical protein